MTDITYTSCDVDDCDDAAAFYCRPHCGTHFCPRHFLDHLEDEGMLPAAPGPRLSEVVR